MAKKKPTKKPAKSTLVPDASGGYTSMPVPKKRKAAKKPLPRDYAQQPATNEDRVAWAQVALDAFAEATGLDESGDHNEDPRTTITDLVTDLLHWCDAHGQDFDEIVLLARHGHYEEVEEESLSGTCETCSAATAPDDLDEDGDCPDCQKNK